MLNAQQVNLDYVSLVPNIVNITDTTGWKFIWQIKTLVISNSFVNTFPERVINSTTYAAAADTAPAVN